MPINYDDGQYERIHVRGGYAEPSGCDRDGCEYSAVSPENLYHLVAGNRSASERILWPGITVGTAMARLGL